MRGWNTKSILNVMALLSLAVLAYNILFFHSLPLGVVVSVIYLAVVSFLCGNVFFSLESVRFRIFYGFISFFCLLVVLGTISYLVYDLSDTPILAILFLLTISMIFLNLKRPLPVLRIGNIDLKAWLKGLNLGILDLLFLVMIGLSFYTMATVRTGESIPSPWSLLPVQFFVYIILAAAILLIMVWRGKTPSRLLGIYTVLLVLIPALGMLILTRYPYDMKNAVDLTGDWMVTNYGRFVVNPAHPEAANTLLGKVVLERGQYLGDVFLIKLFQIPALGFATYFVPITFTLMIVSASFDLMRSLSPERKALACVVALAFLVTQHDIFLFTPPGKNETFAIGLLLVDVLLWVKLFLSQKPTWSSFTVPLVIAAGITLIHQYVGIFAIFFSISALLIWFLKPFAGSLPRFWSWLMINTGLIALWILVYPHVISLAVTLSTSGGSLDVSMQYFTASGFWESVAPIPWSEPGLGFWQTIFYGFINNSIYVTYAFIILGLVAAFILKLNRRWLAVSLVSIVLGFAYFGIVGNFHLYPETYRYFYYFNFLAFPLMGVGLYWLADSGVKLRAWLNIRLQKGEKFFSLRPLQMTFFGLLLACLLIASVWAGYPRPGSMGPYRYPGISYPSDYDFAAMRFIQAREGDDAYKDYFIVGDQSTTVAGQLTIGYQVLPPDKGYQSIYSFYIGRFGWDEFFNEAAFQPIKFILEDTEYTLGLADETYLVFTYRLGSNDLKKVEDFYSECLGEPIYSVEDKIYVFSYNEEKIHALLSSRSEGETVLFDDELVQDDFWKVDTAQPGDMDIVIDDSYDTKESGNTSLEITSSSGTYSYIALRHTFTTPLDLSDAKYLAVFVRGSDSGRKFAITFRSTSSNDYFTYLVTDDFQGWQPVVIPLNYFNTEGNPSWSTISELMVQFFADTWSPGLPLYLDRISTFEMPPLYEGAESSEIM
jgi:hypothetical protein